MNFLAHIYLSGEIDNIKIGNFIADSVKGKKYLDYPIKIQQGIILHRHIDTFTDSHPIVKTSKKRLHPRYGHYDGVIIDILYDHFLAKNWLHYSKVFLNKYVHHFYDLLKSNHDSLPNKVQYLLPHMIRENWLYSYRSIEGIDKVLQGMNRRTQLKSQMHMAIEDLLLNYTAFESDFTEFFEKLRTFSDQKIKLLSE